MRILAIGLLWLWTATVTFGGDWPAWRGPGGNNVAEPGQNLPARFSPTENIIWKAVVPGRGHSSPIVVGSQVLLTTADEQRETQSVLAWDRLTGTLLWKSEVNAGGFPKQIHKKNTHASPTLACDGERLFAVFNNHDVAQLTALSLDGRILWQVSAGPFAPVKYQFGFAPSPLVYKSLVIVASEFEDGFLAAFDKQTGREVWRVPRTGIISFSSPAVGSVAKRDQLFLTGDDHLRAFNPLSGKMLWEAPGCSKATCGTVVWENGMVFASGGFPESETIGVQGDGSGTVVWSNKVKCYEQSLLAHQGFVYAVDDNGIAYCWRARDGKEMWKHRLGGSISASPILVDGRIYQSNESGRTFVFREAAEKFELLAENQLGNEAFATPAVCGGRMFVRVADSRSGQREETLYCIGQ